MSGSSTNRTGREPSAGARSRFTPVRAANQPPSGAASDSSPSVTGDHPSPTAAAAPVQTVSDSFISATEAARGTASDASVAAVYPPPSGGETLDLGALLQVVQATAASQQKMGVDQQDLSAQIRALTRTVAQLVEGSGKSLDRQQDSANTDASGDDGRDAHERGRDVDSTRKSAAELVPSLAKIVDAAEKKYFSLQSRATSAKKAALAQQLVADKIVVRHTSASLSKLPEGAPKFIRTIDPKMVGGPPGFAEMAPFVEIQKKANDLTRKYQQDMTKLVVEHKQECV